MLIHTVLWRCMGGHATHIGRIYNRRPQRRSAADPGKVPTCIQVGVRPETTGTCEKLSGPYTQRPAVRARLTRIGRSNICDGNPSISGLISYERLKLGERPAVQHRARAPSASNAVPDMGQVFQDDSRGTALQGFSHHRPAGFVIDMSSASFFSAGDLPELLSCALAAVGLKTTSKRQVLITPMAQSLTAPELPRAGGGKVNFPDIHTHDLIGWRELDVSDFNADVEVPRAFAAHEISLLRETPDDDLTLMGSANQWNGDTPPKRIERDELPSECVGTFVEMHTGWSEVQGGHRPPFRNAPKSLLCSICLTYGEYGVATHLGSELRSHAQQPIPNAVQVHAIPTPMLSYERHESIARIGVRRLQLRQGRGVRRSDAQLDRRGTQQERHRFLCLAHRILLRRSSQLRPYLVRSCSNRSVQPRSRPVLRNSRTP